MRVTSERIWKRKNLYENTEEKLLMRRKSYGNNSETLEKVPESERERKVQLNKEEDEEECGSKREEPAC